MNRLFRLTTLALVLGTGAVSAQTFEFVEDKPHDPSWEPRYDPTMTCGVLPLTGAVQRERGLAAALAAAENRALDPGAVYVALLWAEAERDPSTAPALRRLVDQYRCNRDMSGLAMMALEALGEPRETFLGYARNWEYNDGMALNAMETLGVRRDSSVYEELRRITLEAPDRGRLGAVFVQGFADYVWAFRRWDEMERWPIDVQVRRAVTAATYLTRGAVLLSPTSGDSLATNPAIVVAGSSNNTVVRRHLRALSEAFPTAVARELADRRTRLVDGVLASSRTSDPREPRHAALHADLYDTFARDMAPTELAVRVPFANVAAGRVALVPSVCVEDRGGEAFFGDDGRAAVFSYTSAEPGPVRVGYGAENALSGARDALAGEWDEATAGGPAPPEVFFPDGVAAPAGRPFRVAFGPGEAVSWTLMGQTVTADAATPRCAE